MPARRLPLRLPDPEGHLWYFGTYQPGAYWDESPEGVTISEHAATDS